MRIFSFAFAGLFLATAPEPRLSVKQPTSPIAESAALAQGRDLSEAGFQAYLPQLRARAAAEGVRPDTLDRVFSNLTFSPRTVQLDRAQPGGTPVPGGPATNANPPFAPYRERHLIPSLIDRGRQRYQENSAALARISQRYGVPSQVLVAIWGKETSYGTVMGDFDLLNSLASLAYDGRRRELFASEFVATLKMMDRGYGREQLKGSWAGATGMPQFLPSVYLRMAADGDGDGRADIWRSRLDALASIANYLRSAGWRPGETWGVRASVPPTFNRAAVGSRLTAPRCERVHGRHSRWMTVADWRRMGVQPLGGLSDNTLATLIEPDGPGATAYLLTNNYRSILDYNCSNFYALTVGLLSDRIAS